MGPRGHAHGSYGHPWAPWGHAHGSHGVPGAPGGPWGALAGPGGSPGGMAGPVKDQGHFVCLGPPGELEPIDQCDLPLHPPAKLKYSFFSGMFFDFFAGCLVPGGIPLDF